MMDQQPLVSVGIPTYNRPEGLRKVLKSIAGQTYENLEIIISDNGSPGDPVRAVAHEFIKKDRRIRYYRQSENIGITGNFNFVLSRSSGEYFMWAADDDEWPEKDYIENCVEWMRQNTGYSIICGRADYYDREGNFLNSGALLNLSSLSGPERVFEYYRTVSDNGVFYGMIRKSAIEGLSLPNKMGGDWLLIAAVAFRGRVATRTDLYFRRGVGGTTASYEKIAMALGLSVIHARHPHICIALGAMADMFWNSQAYGRTGLINRVYMGVIAFFIIFERHCVRPWAERQNPYLIKVLGAVKKALYYAFSKLKLIFKGE